MKPTWEQGDVQLYLGDCLEVLPTLGAGSVDAVVTDPPWKDYQTGRYDASGWHGPIVAVDPSLYSGILYQVTSEPSAIILWCSWEPFAHHADALRRACWSIKNCIVWAKPNHTAGDLSGNLGNQHEMAVFATRGKWHHPGKREVNLWREPHLFSRAKRDHPTEKPVNLMVRSVVTVAGNGTTVLDPFMGSGTTGVACVKTGRRFIGIEIDPGYFDIAVKRISEAQMQPRLDGI